MYSGRFLLMCDERIIPPFSFVVAALLLFVVVAATTTRSKAPKNDQQ